jgi:PAS domain S-box-containing protein
MSNYTINQLINTRQVQTLLESHVLISGMACGLMDNDENIIVGAGLQQICTRFLWDNPESFARCWRNDPDIRRDLHTFSGDLYECRCKNGMINIAMPIIIEGKRLAVFFCGQFFYDDEPPELVWFQSQAKELGFDEEPYLAAVCQVPLFSRTHADNTMRFLHQLVQLLTEIGYANLGRERELKERKQIGRMLLQREQEFRTLAENSPDNIARYDADCRMIYVNPRLAQTVGIPVAELLGKTPLGKSADGERREYQEKVEQVLSTGENAEIDIVLPDSGEGERHHNVRFVAERGSDGTVSGVLAIGRDITERKQAEYERLIHLHFLASMDRVNRAIQEVNDIEQMMSDVLDVVLSIFECDRAYLLYPCDPEAKLWLIPMERTAAGCPGAKELGAALVNDAALSKKLRVLLSSDTPISIGPGACYALPESAAEQFNIKSMLAMAIFPKLDQPWEFGIHQCSSVRTWKPEEERLFQEIGRRLADSMTSLLIHRNLRESEARYRQVFENSPVSIWEEDFSEVKSFFEQLNADGVSDIEAYFDQHPQAVNQCAERTKIIDLNRAAMTLHSATDKDELLVNLVKTFTPDSLETFRQELVGLWQGKTQMYFDTTVKTLAGEPRYVTVYASVCPGYETTLAKCLVSLVDITERKRAESQLHEKQQHLNDMALELTLSEERERRRIATDLHDTLGQDLTLARIKMGSLNKTGLSAEQSKLLGEIKGVAETAINRVRRLTRLLCPPILEGAGLEAALKWLARQIEADYNLQVTFHDDLQDKPVARELQMELYTSVRELLINVAKHAGTATVCLSVNREADTLVIRVEDDGVGFGADSFINSPSTDGFGLFTIKRRIMHMGGSFKITSEPGSGTEVAIKVPLENQSAAVNKEGDLE